MKYRHLLPDAGPQPIPEEWEAALEVVSIIIPLILDRQERAALKLLKDNMVANPILLECLLHSIGERFGKKQIGAPVKWTEDKLLGVFDYYVSDTSGNMNERLEQLAAELGCEFSTAVDLLKSARKLGLSLLDDGTDLLRAQMEDDDPNFLEADEPEEAGFLFAPRPRRPVS